MEHEFIAAVTIFLNDKNNKQLQHNRAPNIEQNRIQKNSSLISLENVRTMDPTLPLGSIKSIFSKEQLEQSLS